MIMKRSFAILLLSAFAISCGQLAQIPGDDTEVNESYGSGKNESKIQGYRDIYDYLESRVAGVMVTTDRRIVIRGVNTVNGSTDPLILVDGQEIQDLSSISPNDVKAVEVLKDGSAAIYGMRGANGVVVITLKK